MNKGFLESGLQQGKYSSPWSLGERVRMMLWNICWSCFCCWTPKPMKRWRLFWLRLFGAEITGTPFVHQKARIQIPWNIILHDRACVGERANLYSLGKIELKAHVTIAQEAYLCTGTHDLEDPRFQLITAGIVVEEGAFVAARSFIMPGIHIGKNAVAGACSVVTANVGDNEIVAGNPARVISIRKTVK